MQARQFQVNMEENIPVEGFTLHYKNTRNKSHPGEIMEDLPEKVAPDLGTEDYTGVYLFHILLGRLC